MDFCAPMCGQIKYFIPISLASAALRSKSLLISQCEAIIFISISPNCFLNSVFFIPQNIPLAPSKLSICLYPQLDKCFNTPNGSLANASFTVHNCMPNLFFFCAIANSSLLNEVPNAKLASAVLRKKLLLEFDM